MRHLFYCDGMITNWGTHLDDGAMWCTGLERTGPVEVEGTGEYPSSESFWNVLLKFRYQVSFCQWREVDLSRPGKPFFKIEGTDGWVYADFSHRQSQSCFDNGFKDWAR